MKKPNMNGIIQSIIWLVDFWRGSMDTGILIFCMTHMDAPTNTAVGYPPGNVRSIHKNLLFRGTTSSTRGIQE